MTTTRDVVRDEVMALVRQSLADEEQIAWRDDDKPEPAPSGDVTWVRPSVRFSASKITTIGKKNAGVMKVRCTGAMVMQLFTPSGDGLAETDRLTKKVLPALRGETTASGVRITDVHAKEIGPDGAWHQTNVIAEFDFDETT